jgi:hypothetical protein
MGDAGVAVCGIEKAGSRYCTPFTHMASGQKAGFYIEVTPCILGLLCLGPSMSPTRDGHVKLAGNFVNAVVEVEEWPGNALSASHLPRSGGYDSHVSHQPIPEEIDFQVAIDHEAD